MSGPELSKALGWRLGELLKRRGLLGLEPSSGEHQCFRIIVPADRSLAQTIGWWVQCDLVESLDAGNYKHH